MQQRICFVLRLIFLVAVANLLSAPLRGQTPAADDSGRSVFKANAQIVVLNVVVTGKNGAPVSGLHQQDFLVSEDGHPQTITYFEEQTGAQPLQASLPPLPPNVFSNIPRAKPGNSVTVLLLDSLNTPLADQSRVRAQTLKFLKGLQPGQRLAIFTLGTRLRFLQGFTDDPTVLTAAINRKEAGGRVQPSPLLQSNGETAAEQETAAAMRAAPAGEGEDAAEGLEQFMADEGSARSDARLQITLDAFQQLAHYLAGIPGRKNVAWFSGAFPVVLLPNINLRAPSGVQRDNQEEVKKTDALLASAQVSIYPISSEGVAAGSLYSADTDARQNLQQVSAARQDDKDERNSAHSAMDEIAKYTGGQAFYGTNDLKDALASVANNGSHYYSLTYRSPNAATDGRYRKIQVKLANSPGYQLAYRQGYYADNGTSQAATAKPPSDPLAALMRAGVPDSTQIPLTLQVLRGSDQNDLADKTRTQSVASPALAGDNHNLQGPLTRYSVHFFIPPGGLLLDLAPNGHRQLSVDAALMVYDREGKSVNWLLRQINLEMDAAHYTTAVANGVNFRLQIDAPADGMVLRSGVYDLKSNLAGTLEVPLRSVVNAGAASPSR